MPPTQAARPDHPLVLAVADGHGSARCFRSDVGARLAVETAGRVLALAAYATQAGCQSLRAEDLAGTLVDEWREAVRRHAEGAPFSDTELAALERKEGPLARRTALADPFLAYGATLLAVLVTGSGIYYLQLGDGDILAVSESGVVTRPVAADDRLFGNETTSLCGRRARHDFRVAFTPLPAGEGAEQAPALILVSTDGYANSFRDDAGFRRVGPDILELVQCEGLEVVESNLASWLDEASQHGSGDDVTLGLLCRVAATAQTTELWRERLGPESERETLLDLRCADAHAAPTPGASQDLDDGWPGGEQPDRSALAAPQRVEVGAA